MILLVAETNQAASNEEIPLWMDLANWIVLVFFSLEVAMRMSALRMNYFVDRLNIFDFVVVATDVCMSLISLAGRCGIPVSVLRIMRLVKLARVLKAFRVFPELALMLGGLVGSMRAVFWGTLLLIVTVMINAILAVMYIHPLNDDISQRGFYTDNCERCPRAYAIVFNAVLTIFQQVVLGDSWGSGTITIIEQYPTTSIFFTFTYVSVGMLVMNLILGVVLDVASQTRANLEEQTTQESQVARLNFESNVLQICKSIDSSKEGHLTFGDICQGYVHDPSFRFMCKQMGISEDEFEILWQCTQKNDDEATISYAAFLTSCCKLRSGDPKFMLSYVKHYVTLMKGRYAQVSKPWPHRLIRRFNRTKS
jgi:hypothetical protein